MSANKEERLYLDHSATTLIKPSVLEEMVRVAPIDYNPSSVYSEGRKAYEAMQQAKQEMAGCLSCDVSELVMTSGGTEADNFAIKGYAFANRTRGKHLIVSAIEHAAVLQSARFLEQCGFSVSYLPAETNGVIAPQTLENAMRPDTILVSVMHVNNETGVIQPIDTLAQIAHAGGAAFFADGVAAAGALPLSLHQMPVDMYAISAHKLGGPKGIGLLYIKDGTRLEPLLHGGGQEGGMRSGTSPMPLMVGMASALKQAQERARDASFCAHMTQMRDRLQAVLKALPKARVSGEDAPRVPHLCHMTFPGLSGEGIAALLDCCGVSISAGSACHAGTLLPSHVLLAMGYDEASARSGVRFSLGEELTETEINIVSQKAVDVIEKLYAL